MLRFPVLSAKHPLKLEYFNPNTMEWEVQDTRVFRSFPTADNPTAGVHVKLHHFSTYRFTQAIAEHAVDERFIDAQWSRDWGIGMKDIKFNRGGRPYYVPVGFRRIGIKVPNFDERFGNWHVGFHGLQHETGLRGVLATGLKTPTQRNEDPQIHRIMYFRDSNRSMPENVAFSK